MDSTKAPYSILSPHSQSSQANIFVGLLINAVLDGDFLAVKAEELHQRWPILGGVVGTKNFPPVPHYLTHTGPLSFASRYMDENLSTVFPYDISFENKDSEPEYRSPKEGKCTDNLFHWGGAVRALHASADTLFAVRVTILRDATLLGFRTSHHLTDAESTFAIIKAYCSLINDEDIPELTLPPDVATRISTLICHADKVYPLANLESQPLRPPSELYPLGNMGLLKFAAPILLRSLMQSMRIVEQTEEKYIHLSGTFVENLKRDCQEELDKASANGLLERGVGLKISNNDAIASWFSKRAFKHTPSASGPIQILSPLDYRSVLQPPLEGTTYLHCSILEFCTDIGTLNEVQTISAAQIALKIRLAVVQNKQPSAIKEALKYMEEHAEDAMAVVPPNARHDNTLFSFSYTNQSYSSLDFSKAISAGSVTSSMDTGKVEGKGKVVFWCPAVYAPLGLCPTPLLMLTKDGRGGYWLRALNWKSYWKWFEEDLA